MFLQNDTNIAKDSNNVLEGASGNTKDDRLKMKVSI